MKKKTLIRAGLLAVVVTLMTPSAKAATIAAHFDDVIMGFHATGGQGQNDNLEVDLGSVSQFHNAAPGTSFAIPGLAVADLVSIYGANWNTRSDLLWGAVATAGRSAAGPDGEPKITLWASNAETTLGVQSTPWNRGSTFAQGPASAIIEPMFNTGNPPNAGQLDGATSTANSNFAADINATLAGSWSKQDLAQAGTSFKYFNPSVDGSLNIGPSGQARLDFYELQPGTGPGAYLGYFSLNGDGTSSFTAVPEPSTVWSLGLGLGLVMMGVRRRHAKA